MNLKLRLTLIHVILPLIIGGSIYIFFRCNTWLHINILNDNQPVYRCSLNGTTGRIITFQFPDFCWNYALASSLFLWQNWSKIVIPGFPLLVALLLLVAEFAQYFLSSMFTFDAADLVAAILAFWLSFRYVNSYEKS